MDFINLIIVFFSVIVLISTIIYHRKKLKETKEAYIKVCENIQITDKSLFISNIEKLCDNQGWDLEIESSDSIIVKTRLNFLTFGEIININIDNDNVTIESSPKYKLTLIDYGRNFKNVAKIKSLQYH